MKLFDDNIEIDYTIRENLPPNVNCIEMSKFESAFLAGVLKKYRPRQILEVGVSAGSGSAFLLSAIDAYGLEAELTSVDISDTWYRDPSKKSGFQCLETFGERPDWHFFHGKGLVEVVESFNKKFDLCILDTTHCLPGEILDFPVALPFMESGGIFVFHDVVLQLTPQRGHEDATGSLLNACGGEKVVPFDEEYQRLPNIAALKITEETHKRIPDVFRLQALKWAHIPDSNLLNAYHDFYLRHYGSDAARWFALSRSWNEKTLWQEKAMELEKAVEHKKTDDLSFKKICKKLLPYGIVQQIRNHRQKQNAYKQV